jgi:FkbM family methyltransferase
MHGYFHLFPFDKIPPRSRIVIYGAGIVGNDFHKQISALNYCTILFFADRNHASPKRFHHMEPLCPPELIPAADFDYVVVAANAEKHKQEIHNLLVGMKVEPARIVHYGASIPRIDIAMNINSTYGGVSWSQCGDDVMVDSIFKILRIHQPSYIDVGAHHPINISNTALFYRQGSRGINVEANPNLIEEFRARRPDDVNLCVGVDVKAGEMPFYMIDDLSGRNTFCKDVAEEFVAQYTDFSITNVIRVPVVTLDSIIEKYAGGKWPHYLSIDIEGLDYAVLRESNLNDGPLVVTVEVHHPEPMRQMTEMMRDKGYLPYCRSWGNVNYVRKDVMDKLYFT